MDTNGVINKIVHVGFVNGDPISVQDADKNDKEVKYRQKKISSLIEREVSLRGYSRRTAEVYLYYNSKFITYIKKSSKNVRKNDIENFILHLKSKGYSPNSINLAISALSFYYKGLYKRRFLLKRVKVDKKNPTILTFSEIKNVLSSIDNQKHRIMVEMLYSSGLRVGELTKLKVRDILFEEKVITIRSGKGNKDRVTILSESSANNLSKYIQDISPDEYIFKGKNNNHISIRSVQHIVNHAAKKAGIKKRVYPHALRHSFATHLKDRDIPLEAIRRLLGHESISTTLIYARLSQEYLKSIKSPLDYNEAVNEQRREAVLY